jgi:drug/metabolite transporter (DMT)-like permease
VTVALALAAAAVFGAGDFLGGFATRRLTVLSVVVFSQAIGLAGMLCVAVAVGGNPNGADLVAGAVAGLTGGAGVAMLYRGLAIGTMALVAPVTGIVAAVVPVAAGLGLGERPGLLQLLGIAAALAAVAMLSASRPLVGVRLQRTALLLAVGSGIGFGLFYIALSKASESAGMWPLVAARGASVSAFVLISVAARRLPRLTRATAAPVTVAGVFDVAANALFLLAVHRGLLSVVAVLVSLYPASTVACSLLFLGERLRLIQAAGVLVALGAVVLITAG